MKGRYLEVTYRNGRPLAAYLYLPRRDGDSAARTEPAGHGLLIDFADDGRPIGIEITSPNALTLDAINAVLARLALPQATPTELNPLGAAA